MQAGHLRRDVRVRVVSLLAEANARLSVALARVEAAVAELDAAGVAPGTLPQRVAALRDERDRARAAAEPARAAVVRAIEYWTGDPDRCDMEGREEQVADTVLAALRGEDLDG